MERRQLLGNLALLGGVTLVMLWVLDAAVAFWPKPLDQQQRLERAASAAGVDLDPRTPLEVMRDMRDSGVTVYPSVYMGNHWQQRPQFRDTIMPLGGLSGVTSLMCSEGQYVGYQADERGFTNPPGTWSRGSVEIAAVGDSYTQGWCVPMEQSFVALLRQDHPSLLSLGFGASGPLLQLAQMREYLPPLRPRRVLWFYYERNDLTDLRDELTHPVLRRYLEPGYSQRLASRQDEIDERLKRFVVVEESAAAWRALQPRARRDPVRTVVKILKLYDLRMLVKRLRAPEPPPDCCDLASYRTVARLAKDLVESWGGRLTVVYLPSEARLSVRPTMTPAEHSGDSVVAILGELGVPVLDLRRSMEEYGTGRELHVYENSHYNARGHRAVARQVQRYLAADTSRTGAAR